MLAKRAALFKKERGRIPTMQSADPWEKRMAQGVAAFASYRRKAQEKTQEPGNG